MGKKKFISGIAFVSIAMLTGGMVSIYEMNRGSVEVKGAAQMVTADTVQAENIKLARAEVKEAVQIDKVTFSCGVSGCTQTEEHQHGLCGIDGCTQIGEHSHGVCNIAGCTETGAHMHPAILQTPWLCSPICVQPPIPQAPCVWALSTVQSDTPQLWYACPSSALWA